jgi:choline dehydrogenase-like flavoprotein
MTDVTITPRGRSGSATHNKEIALSDLAETADVVVAGGGSAGAVLAARFSKDPARTVLPLEAGHAYASDAYPTSLLDANKIADPDHDWGYTSRDMDQIPQIPTPRGCTTAAPKAPPTQTGNRYG